MEPLHRLAAGAALGLALALGSVAHAAETPDPDRVWVKFKPGAKAQVQQALQAAGARFHYTFDNLNAFAVSAPPQALDGIRRNPSVEYVEPDVLRYPLGEVQPYGIGMVQAPAVWDPGVNGVKVTGGVKVCVIDSGIYADHEDLRDLYNSSLMSGSASSGQTWNTDTCGHGTHVAGTIAARANDFGVVGVNKGSISLHLVKVFDGPSCGWSYSSTLVDAAQKCKDAGAKVINMSLGGSFASTTESTAFQSLYDQGVLSVAAAGNDGTTQMSYPASYDSVISVAAVDSTEALASFSQRNSQVELAAPGVGVLSTVPQVSATTRVDGVAYVVAALDGTAQTVAQAPLVSGGLCTTANPDFGSKIVLCERGDITFADKVKNVFNSGGAGVIVYNNAPGGFSGTLGKGRKPNIPAVSMSQEDGQSLVGLVGDGSVHNAEVSTISGPGSGYAYYDGTSMATPHVAGVAALIWSANPSWTSAQIRAALDATAKDLGDAGRDTSYGFGLVQAQAALDCLTKDTCAAGSGGTGSGGGTGGGGGGSVTGVTAKVDSIVMTTSQKGPNYSTRAAVIIVDSADANSVLGGVSVTGCFSGATSGCGTGTTNGSGQITFQSMNYRPAGSVTFCVDNVMGGNVSSFNKTDRCATTP
jgi:serine protease